MMSRVFAGPSIAISVRSLSPARHIPLSISDSIVGAWYDPYDIWFLTNETFAREVESHGVVHAVINFKTRLTKERTGH